MVYKKTDSKTKRKIRVRAKVSGTSDCPRLSIYRSNKYLYAQIINDLDGKTLVAANTLKEAKAHNKAAAAVLGKVIAEKALASKIAKVVFDRGCNRYHGVISEIADNARKAGLKF
ncbi:MAG: 50S ribosomal protein L18 [Deltaproteobacteria bacterium]|nr:50S ribosomal protein L18 [Deltaproteobacteria bacterium]